MQCCTITDGISRGKGRLYLEGSQQRCDALALRSRDPALAPRSPGFYDLYSSDSSSLEPAAGLGSAGSPSVAVAGGAAGLGCRNFFVFSKGRASEGL